MTGKIRMMSAGMGGASRYRVNPWGNQGGGNKKQGLPPTTNKPVQYVLRAINRRAYGTPTTKSYCLLYKSIKYYWQNVHYVCPSFRWRKKKIKL